MSFIDQPKIQFADTAVRDAFGNLRVSQPFTIFSSKQIADNQPLLWDQSVTGAGASAAHQANQASTLMTVPATTASSVIRQSRRWMNYQSGKSQKVIATATFGTAVSGITRRIGIFNDANGLFFQQVGSVLSVVVRTSTSGSPVDTAVDSTAWNLDKMDGTGESGVTIDLTKSQIFVIDFQWLAVGRIRFGFSVGGSTYYCHQIVNANVNTLPYMGNPNLPCRVEIRNNGSGASATLRDICWAVESEGGISELGANQVLSRGATALTTLNDANVYPLIAFRLQSGYLHSSVDIKRIAVTCTSTAVFEYLLVVNPTVTGTALSFTPLANSGIEFSANTTSATTLTGTYQILEAGVDISGATTLTTESVFRPGSTIARVSDIVVLAVRRLSGTTETFYASMTLNEVM